MVRDDETFVIELDAAELQALKDACNLYIAISQGRLEEAARVLSRQRDFHLPNLAQVEAELHKTAMRLGMTLDNGQPRDVLPYNTDPVYHHLLNLISHAESLRAEGD